MGWIQILERKVHVERLAAIWLISAFLPLRSQPTCLDSAIQFLTQLPFSSEVGVAASMLRVRRVPACWRSPRTYIPSMNEYARQIRPKDWPLICNLQRFWTTMLAILKPAHRPRLEIVWRNWFPVRRERSSAALVALGRDGRFASANWLQKLITRCGLSSISGCLWHGTGAK